MHPAITYAEQIAYSSKEVLHFTYNQAIKYKDSHGCFVETGCAAGAQIIAMRAGAPKQQIYAFDSFCGLPWPSNKDNQMPGIRFLSDWEQKALPNPGETLLESTGAVSVSIGDFEQHIINAFGNTNNIIPVKGWFEDTVQHFDKTISLLRLDGDLYNSTYVCLKYLYPKCIKGACIIVDDWALPGCKQAVIDYLAEIGITAIAFQFIKDRNSTVCYWYK